MVIFLKPFSRVFVNPMKNIKREIEDEQRKGTHGNEWRY
jgi:hypothetical protein